MILGSKGRDTIRLSTVEARVLSEELRRQADEVENHKFACRIRIDPCFDQRKVVDDTKPLAIFEIYLSKKEEEIQNGK